MVYAGNDRTRGKYFHYNVNTEELPELPKQELIVEPEQPVKEELIQIEGIQQLLNMKLRK